MRIRQWYDMDRSFLALKEATYAHSRQRLRKVSNQVVMTRVFHAWQQRFDRDQSLNNRILFLHLRHRLLARTFRPWQDGVSHRTERNGDVDVFLLRRRFQLLNRVVRSWRNYVDDQWTVPDAPEPLPPDPPDTPRLRFRNSELALNMMSYIRDSVPYCTLFDSVA